MPRDRVHSFVQSRAQGHADHGLCDPADIERGSSDVEDHSLLELSLVVALFSSEADD
jgi:hypothetical protein